MTTLTHSTALTKPWWTWPHQGIRDALDEARQHLWLPAVRQALNKNAQAGRQPGSFGALREYVGRNRRNLERLCEGRYGLTNQMALGFSVALGLPVSTFFPEGNDWIARTVLVLCRGKLTEAEARAYVAYRLDVPLATDSQLDPATVLKAFHDLDRSFHDAGATERAIRHAADALDTVLESLAGGESS